MTPLMVMSPSSTKPVLLVSFDFGLASSEPSLIELWELIVFPHTLLEMCLAHKTRWRSSAWALLVGKHQQNQNFYLFFSNLRHIEQNEVDVMCFVQLQHW